MILSLILLCGAPALAEDPRPFGQHTMNAGLNLGLGIGGDLSLTIGGNFGYFVLPGLEPGLASDVTFTFLEEGTQTVVSLLPYVRWVFWRAYPFSPYIKAQGGRMFIMDETVPDIWAVGGGVGGVLFINRWAGVVLEGLAMYMKPDEGDGRVVPVINLSFGFFFGGAGTVATGIDDDEPEREIEEGDE